MKCELTVKLPNYLLCRSTCLEFRKGNEEEVLTENT